MADEGTELRCALKDAHTTRYTALAAKAKGDTDVLNDNVIFYLDTVVLGDLIGICHGAKKAIFPKTAGLLINGEDRVFWNDANKVVTKTATDRAIGWGISRDDAAGVAGAAADSDVLIHFHQEVESTTY